MKPCSAYCEPEKGVHAIISWTDAALSEIALVRLVYVGRTMTAGRESCFPLPAECRVLTVDPAIECSEEPFNPRCQTPLLVRVEVAS